MRRALLLMAFSLLLWRVRKSRLDGMVDDFHAYWRRRARRPGELRYVALGDSLSQGLSAWRPEGGFVGLLADELAASSGRTVAVDNLSVTGATVADVLATQLPVLSELDGVPDLVTVCIGTNDVGAGDPEGFRSRFRELCAALPAGALVGDVPDFRHGPHRPAARAHAAICREVLAEFPDLVPVRVEDATRGMRFWELGPDLVHPGSLGHRRYAAAFRSTTRWWVTGSGGPRSGAASRRGSPGSRRRPRR